MLKQPLKIVVLLLALVYLAGCGGTKQGTETSNGMPTWVTSPMQAEDAFFGVGIAQKANLALGKKVADARARDEIVLTIKNRVSTMMRDFMEETLTESGPTAHEYSQSVSEQVGSTVLQGCIIVDRYLDGKTNTWYSLAKYSFDNPAVKNMLDIAKEQAMKKQELYDKFLAEQGFDKLEEKLKSLPAE